MNEKTKAEITRVFEEFEDDVTISKEQALAKIVALVDKERATDPRMKLSDIGDEYNQALKDGSIAKTMKALFKLDKHHLFTPFKMGYYCAVLIDRKKEDGLLDSIKRFRAWYVSDELASYKRMGYKDGKLSFRASELVEKLDAIIAENKLTRR